MSVGRIAPFDLDKDCWDSYVDRLEQYFIANSVKSELKVATLITVIGNDAYELMVSLCTPTKPAARTYSELVTVMKSHLNPKPSMLAERFKFRQRIQKTGESIANYVTELKKLSKDCGFTADSLKENLRDQFVCGLVNDDIRQKLFTEDDTITFDRAYKLAVSMEAAETNAALVEDCTRGKHGDSTPSTTSTSVHQLGRASQKQVYGRANGWERGGGGAGAAAPGGCGGSSSMRSARDSSGRGRHNASGTGSETFQGSGRNNRNMECSVCGSGHESATCKYKAYVCRVCNREGHLKRMCPRMRGRSSLYNMSEQQDEVLSDNEAEDSDEILKPAKYHSYSICEECIAKLRDAVNFKLQITTCEEKFKEYLNNEEALNSRDIKIELEFINTNENADGKTSLILEVPEIDVKQELEHVYEDGNYETPDERNEMKNEAVKQEDNKNEIKKEALSKTKVKKSTTQKPRKTTPKKEQKEVLKRTKKPREVRFCERCNVSFKSELQLNKHNNTLHINKGPFTCVTCPQEHEHFEDMLEHVLVHGKTRVKCRFCDKDFMVKRTLLDHEKSVHIRETVYICDLCNKKYFYKSSLKKHLIWHAGLNKKFFCEQCGNSFNDRTNLNIHVDAVHLNVRKFSCNQCDKAFKAKKHLKAHILTKHEGITIKPYACKDCPAVFSTWRRRNYHVQKCHSGVSLIDEFDKIGEIKTTYYCKGCPEVFDHRGKFKAHVMKHNKEGSLPHICHICGLSFSCKYSLNRHVNNHRGLKPYSCDICLKAFAHQSQVVRHKNRVHNPIKKEKIKCPICKNNVRDLEKHKQIHVIRPFSCELCTRSYPVRNALNRHVRQFHLGIFKHACDICNAKFRNAKLLAKHNRICLKGSKSDSIAVDYNNALPVSEFSVEVDNP